MRALPPPEAPGIAPPGLAVAEVFASRPQDSTAPFAPQVQSEYRGSQIFLCCGLAKKASCFPTDTPNRIGSSNPAPSATT